MVRGKAFLAYKRLRHLLMTRGRQGRPTGARRTIARPRRSPGAPRLAWSHDGWAHADGQLVGLDRLDERYDVTAFGWEGRLRGEPPVTLELLPAVHYGDGVRLVGLSKALRDFDLVWAGGSYEGTTWQALEARRDGGPAVISCEFENIVANYAVGHPVRARAVAEVDHFCVASTNAGKVLELDGVEPERISLVPMVVEMPALTNTEQAALRSEGRRRWEFEDDHVVVLFIGRGVWEKGLHTIAAAASWLATRPDGERVRWLVAGTGDYLDPFARITGHYGASDRSRLVGELDGRDRHVAYSAADILVVPSNPTPNWLEQFGRVIPEAQHFGLPAIGTASGSIPEVIGDAGIVVAPADHMQLADAVLQLVDDDTRARAGERARRRAATEFSVETFVERVTRALELGAERRRRIDDSASGR